jgi:hypothetical protein
MPEITLEFVRGSETWELTCIYEVDRGDPSVGIYEHTELQEVLFCNLQTSRFVPFALSEAEFWRLAERVEDAWERAW